MMASIPVICQAPYAGPQSLVNPRTTFSRGNKEDGNSQNSLGGPGLISAAKQEMKLTRHSQDGKLVPSCSATTRLPVYARDHLVPSAGARAAGILPTSGR